MSWNEFQSELANALYRAGIDSVDDLQVLVKDRTVVIRSASEGPLHEAREWYKRNLPAIRKANESHHQTFQDDPDEELLWFVACRRAEELVQMSQREMAELLMAGVEAVTLEEINLIYEEQPAIVLRSDLEKHFGLS